MAARFGSSAGNESAIFSRTLPTHSRGGDVAIGRPRCGAHVPTVGGVQITGGLQMLGNQRSVVVGRSGITLFDRGGQAPVQLGAIAFELGFVGHRANQRMVKHVLGLSGERDLIDELSLLPGRQ